MRILHVLDHSLPLHSGYAFRTAAILREQRALGWETVQVTTPRQQSGSAFEDADGWRFHRTRLDASALDKVPGARYFREMAATERRIAELADAFRPDVIHYELRALWEDAAIDHGTTREGSARYRVSRALESWALARVDHVTTICEGLRGEVIGRGVPPDRVTVIPNAVDLAAFTFGRPGDPALRRKLGLGHATVVGFAGSFYAYEGLDLLIDAVARLAPSRRHLKVLLVGGGPQEAALRATPDAPHRAGDAAEAARGHGAGPHVRRIRRRRPP